MKNILAILTLISSLSLADTKKVTLEDFVAVRCSADSSEQVYFEWQGEVYSQVEGESQQRVFDIIGMNVARCFRDGDTVHQTTREIQVYVKPFTGKLMDNWLNPWTGEILPIVHVANSPVQVSFGEGFQLESKSTSDGRQTILFSVPLTYPNPLHGDERFLAYDPSPLYQATELFQFHYDETNKANVGITWSRISRFMPWMKMGDRQGSLIFHATGKRLKSYDELNPTLKKVIQERVPNFKYAPDCPLKSKNMTSWTYFKKHFDAYVSQSSLFPIDIRLEEDVCL